MAILEGNGARNSHRGDGYRIGETSYTLNTVEVHAVAVDVRNGVENERTNGTLQAKPNGGMSLNCNNVVRETTGVDVYNGETTGETAVTLTAHAGGGEHGRTQSVDIIGSLCAVDYKGANRQYVEDGKLVWTSVQKDRPPG